MLGIHLVERILDGDIEAIIIALTPFALANGKGLYTLVTLGREIEKMNEFQERKGNW